MNPVDQTIFIDDENGRPGNCWPAAVATILGLELDDVPHFMLADEPWRAYFEFLADRGLTACTTLAPIAGRRVALVTGDSPRGVKHAVVFVGDEMVHDPHPSRAGLTAVDTYEYLIPVNVLPPLVIVGGRA